MYTRNNLATAEIYTNEADRKRLQERPANALQRTPATCNEVFHSDVLERKFANHHLNPH